MAQRDVSGVTGGRPGLLPIFKGIAALFGLLVLLQAFLAGRGLYLDSDLFDVHEIVGQVVVLVALIQVVVAYLALGTPGLRSAIFIVTVVIFILTLVQISLGYSGREGGEAAAWHVLNGVLIFGLTVGNNTMVFRLGR